MRMDNFLPTFAGLREKNKLITGDRRRMPPRFPGLSRPAALPTRKVFTVHQKTHYTHFRAHAQQKFCAQRTTRTRVHRPDRALCCHRGTKEKRKNGSSTPLTTTDATENAVRSCKTMHDRARALLTYDYNIVACNDAKGMSSGCLAVSSCLDCVRVPCSWPLEQKITPIRWHVN